MKTIYYKVITIFCEYPFNDVFSERYVEFYEKTKSKGSKRYKKIDGLKMDSNTTIQDKENYIKNQLKLENVKIIKL